MIAASGRLTEQLSRLMIPLIGVARYAGEQFVNAAQAWTFLGFSSRTRVPSACDRGPIDWVLSYR